MEVEHLNRMLRREAGGGRGSKSSECPSLGLRGHDQLTVCVSFFKLDEYSQQPWGLVGRRRGKWSNRLVSLVAAAVKVLSVSLQSKIIEGSDLVVTKSKAKLELNDMSVQRAVGEGTMSLGQVTRGAVKGPLLKADGVLRLIGLIGMVNRVRQGLLCSAQSTVSHKEGWIKKRGERMKPETRGNKEDMRSSGKKDTQLNLQGEFFSEA